MPELISKRLEILKDAVPKLTRVGVLLSSVGIRTDLNLKELRPAATALKLKLEEIETQHDAKGLESAFKIAKQVGAIMVNPGRRFADRGHRSPPCRTSDRPHRHTPSKSK